MCYANLVVAQKKTVRNDFKSFYDEMKVVGSFSLYDLNQNSYTFYNPDEYNTAFSPGSTFKICHSLIALETGVVADEYTVFKWDGVTRALPEWNKDQDMQSAFKNSTVWFYQECARRIGGKEMKYWLENAKYGNADTVGGLDQFWLTGGLRISQDQQIDFMKRLYKESLPFTKKSMDIVKKIMIAEETPSYTIRAKTGWAIQEHFSTGWYVGYVQTKNNVYFFANCIQDSSKANPNFKTARVEITYKILDQLKLIQRKKQ